MRQVRSLVYRRQQDFSAKTLHRNVCFRIVRSAIVRTSRLTLSVWRV